MGKVSVIIPNRNELFAVRTVNDLLKKATGDIEVILACDGSWPTEPLPDDKRLVVLHHGSPLGMRNCINSAAAVAKGDYLLKCDAHCMFAEGFDETLKADCAENWMVIPRRWSLNAEDWTLDNNGKGPRDYHYLCFPDPHKEHDHGMHGVEWNDRRRERFDKPEYQIDDTMSFQGSCWFMHKTWFDNFLHGMSEVGYGPFTQEPQEIGLKTWLGGGEIKVNKKTWYAHLHKGSRYGRGYALSQRQIVAGHLWSARHWMNNEEPGMIHPISWLIEKFWPVPTWPEDRSLWIAP
jgi:glycosyltransferase involved in cell wall biosynthesis